MPENATTPVSNELAVLKKRADVMGIKYHANIGIESLRQKINAVLEPSTTAAADTSKEAKSEIMCGGETEKQRRARKYKEARQLVRVRITCMNPNKAAWPGEIFSVSNRSVGTIKRFVPFEAEDGWHVERFILKMIKDRKYAHKYQVKVDGKKVNRVKIIPEFSVAEIAPLTEKDLESLGRQQALSGSVEDPS